MKKIKFIFLFVIVLVSVGVYHHFSGDDNRPTSTATIAQQKKPTLSEKNHTVIYQPKVGSNEVPMHFDRLDFGGYHRIEYFVENGYVGLSSQKDTIIGNHHLSNGFPRLNFLFQSADTQSGQVCQEGQYDLANSCPMELITIESNNNYQIAERRKQINAQSPVHQTPPIRKDRLKKRKRQEKTYRQTVNDNTVYQWTAFYTQKHSASKIHDTWIGWECDSHYLSTQNDNIHSWAEKDNLWPMPLSQIQSSACAQHFSSRERWKMMHFPKLSKLTQHPVLWKCSQHNQECKATFDYHGILKTITVPGGAIDKQALKPLDRKRHEMVKMAWKLLQTAALHAESKQTFDIAKALQKDLAQCQEIANISRDLLTVSAEHKKQLHTLWDRKRWAVSSYIPVSPCSRAMHRLIQHHDTPSKHISDQQAFDASSQLVNIEKQIKGDIDQPLNALYNHFASKHYGDESVEAFLIWADRQRIFKQPEIALEKYDRVSNQFNRLTPKQRIDVRLALAYELRNNNNKVRSRELMWLAAKEWMSHPDTLDDVESVSLLFNAAAMTRHSDIGISEKPPKIATLIQAMQQLAEKIAADSTIKRYSKRVHLSALGMHAAWHANYLATKGGITWIRWLDEWFSWLSIVTEAPKDTPPWLLATKVHVEAAKRGEMTQEDCPGSYVSGCTFYPPYPPKE